jgi:hypothetical protein
MNEEEDGPITPRTFQSSVVTSLLDSWSLLKCRSTIGGSTTMLFPQGPGGIRQMRAVLSPDLWSATDVRSEQSREECRREEGLVSILP